MLCSRSAFLDTSKYTSRTASLPLPATYTFFCRPAHRAGLLSGSCLGDPKERRHADGRPEPGAIGSARALLEKIPWCSDLGTKPKLSITRAYFTKNRNQETMLLCRTPSGKVGADKTEYIEQIFRDTYPRVCKSPVPPLTPCKIERGISRGKR